MRLTGTMTGLASTALESTLGIGIDHMMRALGDPVIDILVTNLASLRPSKTWRLLRLSRPANGG